VKSLATRLWGCNPKKQVVIFKFTYTSKKNPTSTYKENRPQSQTFSSQQYQQTP
jgi:hypothetical protein